MSSTLLTAPFTAVLISKLLAFAVALSQVLYNASNFLEKNRDRLGNNLMNVLQKSGNDFIKDLFKAELTDTGVLSRCVGGYPASAVSF